VCVCVCVCVCVGVWVCVWYTYRTNCMPEAVYVHKLKRSTT